MHWRCPVRLEDSNERIKREREENGGSKETAWSQEADRPNPRAGVCKGTSEPTLGVKVHASILILETTCARF